MNYTPMLIFLNIHPEHRRMTIDFLSQSSQLRLVD